LSFFEKSWGSRRTELSIRDIIQILEQFTIQPINLVYPSNYYLLRDFAHAIRRSVHIYDVVPIVDYAAILRIPAVYVHDFVLANELLHYGRMSIINAFDIIHQSDSSAKSGNITISASDVLTVPEWFFRVSKALKLFEYFVPLEFTVASTVPIIHAGDLSTVYDLGVQLNTVKTESAFDKIIYDNASYAKSYSQLFLTLFRRKTPIRYLTLSVSDLQTISELANLGSTATISASDYIIFDDVLYARHHSPLLLTLFRRKTPIRYLTLSVFDVLSISESAYFSRVASILASDYVAFDYTLHEKSYSPLLLTLFRRKTPIRHLILSVFDILPISESAYFSRVIATPASDYIISDDVLYARHHSPLLLTLFRRKTPIRYLTLSTLDTISVLDYTSLIKINELTALDSVNVDDYANIRSIAVHAFDYVAYDYVPHVPPSEIRYLSLYANIGIRTISVFDRIIAYESAWVGPKASAIHVNDYLIRDSVVIVKRHIHAYDVIATRDNANIVRIT